MAPNSLSPASAKIDYHTLYATHHAVLPTLAWFPTSITGDLGSYQAWDLSSIDAEDMWTGLLAVLAPLVPSTTIFDAVTVYTQADAMAPNIPQASHAYAVAGSSGATGLSEANSATFNFKTTGNANAKVVLLDFPLGSGGYNAIHPAGFSAEILALAAYIESTANAFSGRDDNRVNVLRKVTFDLNDKLQKQYRMGA